MMSSLRRWVRALSRPAPSALKPRSRPSLLALEDRVVPTNIGGAAYFAVASGPQNTASAQPTSVSVYDTATGALVDTIVPFGTKYKLGAHVAVGDVNGDGFQDVVVSSQSGADPIVIVYSGAPSDGMFPGGTPRVLKSFYPYFNSFRPDSRGRIFPGGVNVAVGDVNGDGFDDVITGAGGGGAPHVRVFSGADIGAVSPVDPTSQSGVMLNFFAGFAANFTGGARVGSGDVGGDHRTSELIVTAGPGGSSHTIVYALPRPGDPPVSALQPTRLGQFFAFPTSYAGGSYVTGGALTNNRDDQQALYGDIIVSKGRGPAEVRVFRLLDAFESTTGPNGTIIGPNYVFTADLTDKTTTPNVDFTANFGSSFQGGGTVATFHAGAVSANSTEFDAVNMLVGAGPGATPVVLTFGGSQLSDGEQVTSQPTLASPGNFTADFGSGFGGGAFVS